MINITLTKIIAIIWERIRWRLILLIIISLLASIMEMFGIGMVLPFFSVVSEGEVGDDKFSKYMSDFIYSIGYTPDLSIILVFIIFAFLFKAIFTMLVSVVELWTSTHIRKDLQIRLASLVENARFAYLATEKMGSTINLLTRECDRYSSTIRNLAKGIVAAITSIMFVITVGIINPRITFFIILCCIVLIVGLRPLIKWTRNYSVATTKNNISAQSALIELVNNFVYLKSTNRTKKFHENIIHRINNLTHIQRCMGLISSTLTIMKEPIGVLALTGIIYYEVIHTGQQIGEVIVVGLFLYRIVHRLLDIQNNWQRVNDSIGGVIAVEEGIERLEAEQEEFKGKTKADLNNIIRLSDVYVKYSSKEILSNINILIRPNETIGIVGPSGSGKTTLFHLVTGLLEPTQGSIYLGDVDYKNIDKHSLRCQIGYVTQDSVIFHTTLAQNICFWECEPKTSSGWNSIKKAAELAGCEELLEDRAFDLAGEQGKQLSGGQKQRIAIARELFKNPRLLIFDEATSSLDSDTEKIIQENIKKMKGKKTILLISHRLSSVKDVDKIYVLLNGCIVEKGSFNELYNTKDSVFRSMCDKQGVTI